jgi:hypothetical protein
MTQASLRRIVAVLAGALAFGVAMSVLKGNGAGTRSTIGNLSAPWLLVPFLAAVVASGGRVPRAIVIGTAASLVALGGFYVANSIVLDLGSHSWLDDVRLAVAGGRPWFELGAVSGPVLGALGGLWARFRRLGVVVCALLVVEPVVELAGRHAVVGNFALGAGAGVAVGGAEAAVGVLACVAALRLAQVGVVAGDEQSAHRVQPLR